MKYKPGTLEYPNCLIIAIDPATLSGLAIGDTQTDYMITNTINLDKHRKDDPMYFDTFFNSLDTFYNVSETTFKYDHIIVAIEDSSNFSRGLISYNKLAGLRAVTALWANRLNAVLVKVSPHEIKSFATGNAKATKEDMIDACYNNYDVKVDDHNIADAIHLLQYVRELYNRIDDDPNEPLFNPNKRIN